MRICADVGQDVDLGSLDAPLLGPHQPHPVHRSAAVGPSTQVLTTTLCPHHGPGQAERQGGGHGVLRVGHALHSEGTTHIGDDDMEHGAVDAQEFGQPHLCPMGSLVADVDGQPPVVLGHSENHQRLDRIGRQPLVGHLELGDDVVSVFDLADLEVRMVDRVGPGCFVDQNLVEKTGAGIGDALAMARSPPTPVRPHRRQRLAELAATTATGSPT